ncbi:MAG: UDP-N-acetylmuramoyl-L-alanyl-D-glutamate--2,6-diaminopimelate ligase [Alphaproteobacteria bacterium]|nr:UDP-N-acetylmuramoyl-L-alanyl-D-glutamate--2,6-diaminopimelate ligase [Alphaproteobacteria bacterium]
MRLSELIAGVNDLNGHAAIDQSLDIAGLTSDSRAVRPGHVFAALPGAKADGRDFIPAAVAQGAVAVLAQPGTRAGVPVIESDNPRRAFALLAARFYGRQPEHAVAVTGTNGKTSSASFVRQILERLGRPAVTLGTLGLHGAGFDEPGRLTTPDPVKLHETLARVKDAGVEWLAMEASSHGLEQHRLDGVRVIAGAFTNITRDHLDYHGDMRSYFQAKLRLFSEVVVGGGWAVINADSPEGHEVVAVAQKRGLNVITFGRRGGRVRLRDARPTPGGQDLDLVVDDQALRVHLPLAGGFQAENALCALGLVMALGLDGADAAMALEHLDGVPGRLQLAGARDGWAIYVDYAHTPDALHNVLAALRPHTEGRLMALFGCGGDRDAGKRPVMGGVATEHADVVYVTDDNPRGEDPATIRAAILAAAPGAVEIADRRAAIRTAVADLRPGDVLVLAGKGHEQGQIVGDAVLPFDDVQEAKAAMDGEGRP